MRNSETGVWEWTMWVVRAIYNPRRPGWDYVVKDANGDVYDLWVEETRLRAA